MTTLHEHYKNNVIKELTDQFGYKSCMQVPKITKVTLNMGLGEAVADKKIIENKTKKLKSAQLHTAYVGEMMLVHLLLLLPVPLHSIL